MAIPVFTNDTNFSANHQFQGASVSSRSMTVESTIQRTALLFGLLLITGAVGWFIPILALPAALSGLGVGLWVSFKREPSAPLTAIYAALQGFALGGISGALESFQPGIVIQAVLATISVFAVVLVMFVNNRLRATPRMTKIFSVAIIGYMLFSLLNLGLMMTGSIDGMFGINSQTFFGIPIGIPLGILATLLASYSLVLDFEYIKHGVANNVPEKYEWKAAFGLLATIVWLYVEMLRLISIFRN